MRWHGQRRGGADNEIDLQILAQQVALQSDGSDDAVIQLGVIASQLKTTFNNWVFDIKNVGRVLMEFDNVVAKLRRQRELRAPVQAIRRQPSQSHYSTWSQSHYRKRSHGKPWPEDTD